MSFTLTHTHTHTHTHSDKAELLSIYLKCTQPMVFDLPPTPHFLITVLYFEYKGRGKYEHSLICRLLKFRIIKTVRPMTQQNWAWI
jgi:hypothetical protein